MPQTIFQLAHKQLTYSLIHSQLTRLTNAQNEEEEEVNYRTKRPNQTDLSFFFFVVYFLIFALFGWCPSSAFYFFLFQCALTIIPDECQNADFCRNECIFSSLIAQQPPKTVKADSIAKVKAAA